MKLIHQVSCVTLVEEVMDHMSVWMEEFMRIFPFQNKQIMFQTFKGLTLILLFDMEEPLEFLLE